MVVLIKSLLESDVEPKQIGRYRWKEFITFKYVLYSSIHSRCFWSRLLNLNHYPTQVHHVYYEGLISSLRCHYTVQVSTYGHYKFLEYRRVSLLTVINSVSE